MGLGIWVAGLVIKGGVGLWRRLNPRDHLHTKS